MRFRDLSPALQREVERAAGIAGHKLRQKAPRIDMADELLAQLQRANHTGWARDRKFHPVRRWQLDLTHEAHRLAVEVEGFAPKGGQGRHQRPKGFAEDCEKYAEAVIAGWRVMRVTTNQVRNGLALQWIERAIAQG